MKKLLLLIILASLAVPGILEAQNQAPNIGYVYPAGGQKNRKHDFLVVIVCIYSELQTATSEECP